eukprot:gnl/TRDRNA2_/TRDRNA2_137013_c0_seq1.p1 gnl/TRDRNA2_/TRDRNA2_137013_c0~~gnl/TRDRNA2_/TRDRNA2_137013_c0_seq1.p1  ORF type:complete len:276 (-),score=23.94 gnl/TRDRNA2_/TRDRNA2_137013_c0_seq1:22-771(-)
MPASPWIDSRDLPKSTRSNVAGEARHDAGGLSSPAKEQSSPEQLHFKPTLMSKQNPRLLQRSPSPQSARLCSPSPQVTPRQLCHIPIASICSTIGRVHSNHRRSFHPASRAPDPLTRGSSPVRRLSSGQSIQMQATVDATVEAMVEVAMQAMAPGTNPAQRAMGQQAHARMEERKIRAASPSPSTAGKMVHMPQHQLNSWQPTMTLRGSTPQIMHRWSCEASSAALSRSLASTPRSHCVSGRPVAGSPR